MAFGITINTSIEVANDHPNKNGKFGLTYPAPGNDLYHTEENAQAAFDAAVAERRALNDDFVATLNRFTSRGEETIRRASK